MTADPYARITELDETTVARLADRIAIRAADPRQQRLWRDFLARPSFGPGDRVLEVGCGTGVITGMIADLTRARAVGVDPSPQFVERARRARPDLRFEVADGRALPFADCEFDGVVFATTLCHIPNPELALAEARRVLRNGGVLAVYDGDYSTATVAVHRHDPLQQCVEAAIDAIVHNPWLVRRLPSALRAAGFSPGELLSHGHIEVQSPRYLISMIELGADVLAADEVISVETAACLKSEARAREEAGSFFGHIAYASIVALVG